MYGELLTVEAVIMVVGVTVITLFAEFKVHNTVTTSAHLQTRSHSPRPKHKLKYTSADCITPKHTQTFCHDGPNSISPNT